MSCTHIAAKMVRTWLAYYGANVRRIQATDVPETLNLKPWMWVN